MAFLMLFLIWAVFTFGSALIARVARGMRDRS
jgi:hypothetical protein